MPSRRQIFTRTSEPRSTWLRTTASTARIASGVEVEQAVLRPPVARRLGRDRGDAVGIVDALVDTDAAADERGDHRDEDEGDQAGHRVANDQPRHLEPVVDTATSTPPSASSMFVTLSLPQVA